MPCFSLAFVEGLCVDLVIIFAVIAIIKIVVPLLLGLIGAPIGGAIAQIINIVLWAIVAILVIYVVFGSALVSCWRHVLSPSPLAEEVYLNLHGIVKGAVGAVNPHVSIAILISDGYFTSDDMEQIPVYFPPINTTGQIQSLTFKDIEHLNGLNIQGSERAMYISGRIDGLIRPEKKGGDLINVITGRDSGTTWLVTHVLEYWPDWCKTAITRQNVRKGGPSCR